jgi:hypothetical protein
MWSNSTKNIWGLESRGPTSDEQFFLNFMIVGELPTASALIKRGVTGFTSCTSGGKGPSCPEESKV